VGQLGWEDQAEHAKPCGPTRVGGSTSGEKDQPRGGRIKQSKGYLEEEDQTEHRVPQRGVGRGGGTPSPLLRWPMMLCGDQGI